MTGASASDERQPPSPEALARAIETQRQELGQIRELVHSQAILLHETYEFDIGEADLGYCCDVVRDLLDRILATLEPLSVPSAVGNRLADPMLLARMIEAPRQVLFRAQAVAEAVENLMRAHQFHAREGNLRRVMETIVLRMEQAISALEPFNLGLPIPQP